MAQTRAGAKALRNRLSWVVVLAGYKSTPAEEMTESTVSEAVKERRTIDKSSHYCGIHNVNFFKKGRMKNYAHPIENTKEWCNEPDTPLTEPETSPTPAESQNKPAQAQTGSNPPVPGDIAWFKESLATLGWADVGGYLKRTYKVAGTSVSDMIGKLTAEQRSVF